MRVYITRIDPPIGPYDRIVTWNQPRRWRHRLWLWILRKFGLRDR